MNILIFSWRGPGHPNAGGAEISTHEHAKSWVKAGHSVTLFTSQFAGGRKEEVVDGVKIIRAGRQVLGVQIEVLRWYLFGSHLKYDLVVDQFHGIPFFTPLFFKGKKLAFIHEVTKEVWKYNTWSLPLSILPSILGPLFEPMILKLFYRNIPFMTVSESTKKDLIDWQIPDKNITVVHNGIDKPQITAAPKKEKKKTLIFLGAISKDKGVEDALKIFSYINQKDKDWQFWVVGKSDKKYLQNLKKIVNKLGLMKIVKFWGYVNEKEKYRLLARAHLMVNPSIREGWGLVVIEAASVGTPAVGYNVPGLRDSIQDGETGILCDKDPKRCAEEIVKLLQNHKKYQEMSTDCKRWSEQFNWGIAGKKSLKLIESLT